ncbi:MAG: 23S rRNA (adenine(2503)-C(2))-methyltransferase RlmN [Bacteroidales bacterium]|jgi:23S rRNA (adenine(2503)-C(2))-methyltransferase|nr:23S rRNA (adenine(2503)-C(2))-methyltransferase RlmN [Bacteroidales bacterium]
MTDILKITHKDLINFLTVNNEPPFRAKQIEDWLWKKGATDFEEMSNLSLSFRELLKKHFFIGKMIIQDEIRSKDKTTKFVFELSDGLMIEGVLIPSYDRVTACISSQVGCPLGCLFCATGTMGFRRNLHFSEIYGQYMLMNAKSNELFGQNITNIVYMGMGEPLLNYENVMESIALLTSKKGQELSPSRITLSTAGISDGIRKLADDGFKPGLAVSLHTVTETTRSSIMPANKSNSLSMLHEALRYYHQKTGNRITFEYMMLDGVNDSLLDAEKLAIYCRTFPVKINLIEYNNVDKQFVGSSNDRIDHFVDCLEAKNMVVNVRRSKGKDIAAACGQLVKKNAKNIAKKSFVVLFMLFCSFCSNFLFSQNDNPSKSTLKLIEKASQSFKKGDFEQTHKFLDKILGKDTLYDKTYILRAELYTVTLEAAKAADDYNHAIRLQKTPKSMLYFNAATEEIKCGRYEAALEHFNKSLHNGNSLFYQETMENMENCRFAIEALKNPVTFDPVNLGANINAETDEYLATLTADEMEFIFTVRRPKDEKTICDFCLTEEDFYFSLKKEGLWQPRQPLSNPVNTSYNEGAQTISPDGRYLYYTMCNTDVGYGSCDLYWSKRIGDRWSRPRNMGNVVNSQYWESQPAIGPDGKTIYFASNRPGGEGGIDLWKTEVVEEGVFSTPVNLGKTINTKKDDTAPFLHADGRTLYFASDGRPGMGGKDLYFATYLDHDTWSEPLNLGYPINTPDDEVNIVINAQGNRAYFASDKPGGFGGLDLYSFILDEHLRPIPVTYIKGKIEDALTHQPLETTLEMIDLNNHKTVTSTTSDPISGEFLACILTGTNILLNITHPDYPFYSENFQIDKSYSNIEPYLKDIQLVKANIGNTFVLRNIFFEFDKSTLKTESYTELDLLTAYLTNHKNLSVEIGGHTDNQGGDEYNLQLSLERAKTVYHYLITKGILPSRLSFRGYGKTKPIADNETEQGRATNRRTEFKIVGN